MKSRVLLEGFKGFRSLGSFKVQELGCKSLGPQVMLYAYSSTETISCSRCRGQSWQEVWVVRVICTN